MKISPINFGNKLQKITDGNLLMNIYIGDFEIKVFYGIVTEGKDQILYRVVKKGSIKTIELVLWTQYEFNNLEKKLIDKIVKLELPDMITIVASSESFILPSTKNFFKAPSQLNFVASDYSDNQILSKLIFRPILYDTV